jgi:hypothetical protein
MFMDEIRNQFKSQTLNTLKASSINTVGGRVFPDAPAITDLEAFKAVVQSWQGVHAPTYGQPIAGTNAVVQGTGQGNILELTNDNEVVRIDAVHINNLGAAPLTAYIRIGDCPINSSMDSFNNAVLQPNGNAIIVGPFFMDSTDALNAVVTDGTANDLEWSLKYSKVVQ